MRSFRYASAALALLNNLELTFEPRGCCNRIQLRVQACGLPRYGTACGSQRVSTGQNEVTNHNRAKQSNPLVTASGSVTSRGGVRRVSCRAYLRLEQS